MGAGGRWGWGLLGFDLLLISVISDASLARTKVVAVAHIIAEMLAYNEQAAPEHHERLLTELSRVELKIEQWCSSNNMVGSPTKEVDCLPCHPCHPAHSGPAAAARQS